MIFFWPNFDVRKEQISNAKREVAKQTQKIHIKLQPSQETDPNSNIEKGKTSAGFASKVISDIASRWVASGVSEC